MLSANLYICLQSDNGDVLKSFYSWSKLVPHFKALYKFGLYFDGKHTALIFYLEFTSGSEIRSVHLRIVCNEKLVQLYK